MKRAAKKAGDLKDEFIKYYNTWVIEPVKKKSDLTEKRRMGKIKNVYFYLIVDPDEKRNPSGIAYAPEDLLYNALDDGTVYANSKSLVFKLQDGAYVDYLANDMGWRLCSLKLKKILEKYLIFDDHQWLEIRVVDEHRGEIETYYFLHFIELIDVFDESKTEYIDKEDNIILKAHYDYEKIGGRMVLTDVNGSTILHELVKNEIMTEKCTGLYMYGVHGDPGETV